MHTLNTESESGHMQAIPIGVIIFVRGALYKRNRISVMNDQSKNEN